MRYFQSFGRGDPNKRARRKIFIEEAEWKADINRVVPILSPCHLPSKQALINKQGGKIFKAGRLKCPSMVGKNLKINKRTCSIIQGWRVGIC